MGTERTVIVVTGGDPVDAELSALPPADAVVAADSGAVHALALGLSVDLAVGDFDSVDEAVLDRLRASGAEIDRHPEAKDSTDLEIGLVAARRLGATHVVVLGGHGGRIDHFIANALLLAAPRFADLRVVARVGPAQLTVIHDRGSLSGTPGDLVSLLPVAGPVLGVTTRGLVYPLAGEDLLPGTTRGVSNELSRHDALIEVGSGALLVVQPGERGTHLERGLRAGSSEPTSSPDNEGT